MKEMNKLFQDFAPFSFIGEHGMPKTDEAILSKILFFDFETSKLLHEAKIWLNNYIFTDENISIQDVISNCEDFARRCTKKLEHTHNFMFLNSIDPSTLLHATELSSDIKWLRRNLKFNIFLHI